jgi:hypothetical protein
MAAPVYIPSHLVLHRDGQKAHKILISGINISVGDFVRIESKTQSEMWYGIVSKKIRQGNTHDILMVLLHYHRLQETFRASTDDLLDLTVVVVNPGNPPSSSPPTDDIGVIDSP